MDISDTLLWMGWLNHKLAPAVKGRWFKCGFVSHLDYDGVRAYIESC